MNALISTIVQTQDAAHVGSSAVLGVWIVFVIIALIPLFGFLRAANKVTKRLKVIENILELRIRSHNTDNQNN